MYLNFHTLIGIIAILPRFELGISESKSDVLPLHHRIIFVALNLPRSKMADCIT